MIGDKTPTPSEFTSRANRFPPKQIKQTEPNNLAMLLYNVAVTALLAFASVGLALHGVALWPAVVLHSAMTVWCVACLRRNPS
jgi:hypothetical protein